jgi:hypothetical protein
MPRTLRHYAGRDLESGVVSGAVTTVRRLGRAAGRPAYVGEARACAGIASPVSNSHIGSTPEGEELFGMNVSGVPFHEHDEDRLESAPVR